MAPEAIRLSANGQEVHEAVSASLEADGYPRLNFLTVTDYNLAVAAHELPFIAPIDMQLQEGGVGTVEPGLNDHHRRHPHQGRGRHHS